VAYVCSRNLLVRRAIIIMRVLNLPYSTTAREDQGDLFLVKFS